jgi:hypothetical protein
MLMTGSKRYTPVDTKAQLIKKKRKWFLEEMFERRFPRSGGRKEG